MWNFNDASSGNICGSVANFCMTSSAPLTRSRTCTISGQSLTGHQSIIPRGFFCTGKCTRKHKKNLDLMVTVKLHGKRRIERRLFFPTVASSLSLCFLKVFCFRPFFGPSQILRQTTLFYQCCICKCIFFSITSFAGRELF